MNFPARMFAWEDRVQADAELRSTPFALHLVVWLRKRFSEGKGWYAYQKDLAEQLGVSVRTLSNAISALTRREHLVVVSGKSDGVQNLYIAPSEVGNRLPTIDAKSARYCRPRRQPVVDRVGSQLPTNNHSSSPKDSGGADGKIAAGYGARKDRFSDAHAKLKADLAAEQDGESGGRQAVRSVATAGRR